jgi:hypothetical protein
MRKRWKGLILGLILALLVGGVVRIEHIQDENMELWDAHLPGFDITYTYGPSEGAEFCLTREGQMLLRWPEYQPRPTPKPRLKDWQAFSTQFPLTSPG